MVMQVSSISVLDIAGRIHASASSATEDDSADTAQAVRQAASAGGGSKANASSGSAADGPIAMLKATIERLQKQLASLQRQLAQVMRHSRKDDGPDPQVMGLQAQIGAVTAALQKAVMALAELMQSTGASGAGALVSTSA